MEPRPQLLPGLFIAIFRTGAPTSATPGQRVLDFLLRTLERPYRSNNLAALQSRPRMILLEATFTHIKSDGYPADQFRQNYH